MAVELMLFPFGPCPSNNPIILIGPSFTMKKLCLLMLLY